MTRIINALDEDTAARVRAAISGKPVLKEAKAKRAEPVKCLVSQFHSFDPRHNVHTVQLPIAFRSAEYNAGNTPQYLRSKWATEKRDHVWLALNAYFPRMRTDAAERERVTHMEFVRFGVKNLDAKDNLRMAFKAIVDATCSFLRWGADAPAHLRAIGSADDYLEQRGLTWDYRQQKCPSNPRLYGIQIKLHCVPSSTTP